MAAQSVKYAGVKRKPSDDVSVICTDGTVMMNRELLMIMSKTFASLLEEPGKSIIVAYKRSTVQAVKSWLAAETIPDDIVRMHDTGAFAFQYDLPTLLSGILDAITKACKETNATYIIAVSHSEEKWIRPAYLAAVHAVGRLIQITSDPDLYGYCELNISPRVECCLHGIYGRCGFKNTSAQGRAFVQFCCMHRKQLSPGLQQLADLDAESIRILTDGVSPQMLRDSIKHTLSD